MLQGGDVIGASLSDFEAWKAVLRPICGRYDSSGPIPDRFRGWARILDVYGLPALDVGCNVERVERTSRDIRLDGFDHYFALFQVHGTSAVTQNDRDVRLAAGDVVLVDAARPLTLFGADPSAQWLSLHLPRQALVTHLGLELQGGCFRRSGTPAVRLLNDAIIGAHKDRGNSLSPADSYMQLAAFDLVGALFAPSDPVRVSSSAGKLFARICGVIKEGFSDPDFGPAKVATEAGVSLRYVQKLFMQHGSTCGDFIYSLRLDRAAHLIRRQASRSVGLPLSEIAYACGFRDYAHFARKFRFRFGCAPRVYAGKWAQGSGEPAVRVDTGSSALLAHDLQPLEV